MGSNSSIVVAALALHISALFLLTFGSSSVSNRLASSSSQITSLQVATIFNGLAAGSLTIFLPYLLDIQDPVAACPLRVVCFFYGCKIFDLTVARAQRPPCLIQAGKPEPLSSFSKRLKFVWLLLTETRYASFDIAVHQKERTKRLSSICTLGPAVAIPIIVYMVPTAETKSLMAMLVIQFALEGLHSVLHPFCAQHLFWHPFAASSLTSFWRTHWHAGAESFLRSLAFQPARDLALWVGLSKNAARAVGVVAAFSLSGVWHGWATAVLATRPWMVGFRVWSLFVSMGIGVIIESSARRELRGTIVHRTFVWVFFMIVRTLPAGAGYATADCVKYAGWAWRGLQSNCKVQWLAEL